jgi:hypothetical protein
MLSTLLALGGTPPSGGTDPSLGRDFHLAHSGWNGLSRLGGLARDLACGVEVRRTLDWSQLDGQDIVFVLHPETALDPEAALAYVSAGGRLIIADDFGKAGPLLARLGIVRSSGPAPSGTRLYRGNSELPLATPQRGTALGRAASEIAANHAAYFSSSLPATYAFAPGAGLIIEGTLGRGRFIAVSDPSIFINNMLEITGNRDFVARLVVELCRPQRDRMLLVYGPFTQLGFPPPILAGAPLEGGGASVVERWNRGAAGVNLHIQETLKQRKDGGIDVIGLCGLLFCFGALALLVRYLPMPVPPQDDSFAQPPRPPETGLFASVARYTVGAGQAVGWGYVYPATLLREEVLARLQPLLVELPPQKRDGSTLGTDEIQGLVGKRVSPRAGELTGILLREIRKLDRGQKDTNHPSDARISARLLQRWYDLATELFAEFDKSQAAARTRRNPQNAS